MKKQNKSNFGIHGQSNDTYKKKKLCAIDEQLIELATKIEAVEFYIKACSDPDERMRLGKKEEQLRNKGEELREKEKEQMREVLEKYR